MRYKICQPAENYLLLDFKNTINEKINKYIVGLAKALKHEAILEVIPAYSSLLIEFDNKKIEAAALSKYIRSTRPGIESSIGREFKIPVVYGGEFGPDLSFVAKSNNLTGGDVVKIHSSVSYRVYMLGFMPGFCYLGGMDPRIACGRLETPRLKIVKGSVGIAGRQTGIYPSDSPGGWRIIGRTNFELYMPGGIDPFPVRAGDSIKFTSVKAGDIRWK